ncbi:MAG: hypothetical protein ACRC8S_18065 [Fimbriiglobus sp.]
MIPEPKVLQLLQEGLIELRALAEDGDSHQQIAHLADVLEYLPSYCSREVASEDWLAIRSTIEGYAKLFPGMSDRLVRILDLQPAHSA